MVGAAVPVGNFVVVVVNADTSVERFGRFERQADALTWAMRHRDTLGLPWCASWHIEKVPDRQSFGVISEPASR